MPSSKKPSNIEMPSKKMLQKLVRPYSEDELSGEPIEDRVKKLMEFFDQYGLQYEKFTPEYRSFLDEKKAYPNYDQYMPTPGQHNTNKWLMAIKDVYYKQKSGVSFKDAIRQTTDNWKKMEVYDFLNWLKFYQEGAHMKYKTAQVWYENGQPGYFLHIKPDAVETPVAPQSDTNSVDQARQEADDHHAKRELIEKQRAKIIGRLDSAEKLLRSHQGQQFAGNELESLMEAIYNLKKKVQLVNKLSVSTRLYEDMIIREANVLTRYGFNKAANLLHSLAQTPGQSGQQAAGNTDSNVIPSPASPGDPTGVGNPGAPGGLPAIVPGVPDVNTPANQDQNKDQPSANALLNAGNAPSGTAESSPAIIPQEEPQPLGIKEFINNMNLGNKTDTLEVDDQEEELMVSEAQIAPIVPPGPPPEVLEDVPIIDDPPPNRGKPANLPPPTVAPVENNEMTVKEEPLEVSEDEINPQNDLPADSEFDYKVDGVFQSATMEDIINEMEIIARIFRLREIPRRISRVDLMLDGKGISSFFPTLAEMLNKQLDANNYCSTRAEDILSKLRGALNTRELDLESQLTNATPEVAAIRNKLQKDEDQEKQRKQQRKELEQSAFNAPAKETPKVEMEDLAPPVPTKPLV